MNEYYMVTKRTWRKANPADKGMLCIGCLEMRLNRKLTLSDFIWCPVNVMNAYDGSNRLRERLGCDFMVPASKTV